MKNGLLDCALGAHLHCDQGVRLSTCLEHGNGHRCSLAKCAANKDQITILARQPVGSQQVFGGLEPGSWSLFLIEWREKSHYSILVPGTTFTHTIT